MLFAQLCTSAEGTHISNGGGGCGGGQGELTELTAAMVLGATAAEEGGGKVRIIIATQVLPPMSKVLCQALSSGGAG